MKTTSIKITPNQITGQHDKLLFFGVLAAVYIVMLAFNFLTPLIADDFSRTAPRDVFSNMIDLYKTWGGRIFSGFFVPFLTWPKFIFNIANALMYVVFILLIYRFARVSTKKRLSLLLFVCAIVWIFTIDFGQVYLWELGSLAYLWALNGILLGTLPYYIYAVSKKNIKFPVILAVAMAAYGFLIGFAGETSTGGAILAMVFFAIFAKRQGRCWMLWQFTGVFATTIGFILMLIAPGNRIRAEHFPESDSLIRTMLERFIACTKPLAENLFILVAGFAVLITLQIILKADKQRIKISLAFFLIGIATIYAMMLAPTGTASGRSFFGGEVFLFIACAHAFATLLESPKDLQRCICSAITVTSFLYFLLTVPMEGVEVYKYKELYNERVAAIETQKSEGRTALVVPAFPEITSRYVGAYGLEDLSEDHVFWVNKGYAVYFGVDSIIAGNAEIPVTANGS